MTVSIRSRVGTPTLSRPGDNRPPGGPQQPPPPPRTRCTTHPVDDDPNPWRPSAARHGELAFAIPGLAVFAVISLYGLVDAAVTCRGLPVAADRAAHYDALIVALTVVLLLLHPMVALACGHHRRGRS